MDSIEFADAPERVIRYESPEPWKAARQTPDRWFMLNWRQFLMSPDDILARAVRPDELEDECDAAGIYFLIDPDGLIAYVGMSTLIGTRLANHQRRGMPMDRVAVLTGIPDMFIKDIEAFYIQALRPPINSDLPTTCYCMEDDLVAAKAGELWEGWKPMEWCIWSDPASRTRELRTLDGVKYEYWTPPKW